jgi:hypothetical protein
MDEQGELVATGGEPEPLKVKWVVLGLEEQDGFVSVAVSDRLAGVAGMRFYYSKAERRILAPGVVGHGKEVLSRIDVQLSLTGMDVALGATYPEALDHVEQHGASGAAVIALRGLTSDGADVPPDAVPEIRFKR